jgi:FtsP/CotA-like multicopper oxidase with cupredoxin domain
MRQRPTIRFIPILMARALVSPSSRRLEQFPHAPLAREQCRNRTDVIPLSPGQVETVDMIPDNLGTWLFHCHISDHMVGGMVTRYKVEP